MPQISIVICTFNRAKLLKGAIESLLNQNADLLTYEIIVVNNNSTDNTEDVVKNFVDNYSNVHLVLELNQGLSHSRNRGYREATAEYVAYLDDDAKVFPNWLETAIKIINEQQPDIFGGPIYPFYLTPKPEWFKDEYEIRVHSERTGWMQQGYISGSNIVIRKTLLFEYGGFDPQFGMKGNNLGYHEESDLIIRAFQEGKRIYYSLELKIEHLVADFKKSLAYFIYYNYKAGKDSLNLFKQEYYLAEINSLFSNLQSIMDQFEVSLKKRDDDLYSYPENYIIEKVVGQFYKLGQQTEYFIKITKNFETKQVIFDILTYFKLAGKSIGIKDFCKIILMSLSVLNIAMKIRSNFFRRNKGA